MSSASARFSITPQAAVGKFLVDMRLAAERDYLGWRRALLDGLSHCQLAPRERLDLLKLHPVEDYFYAGLIGRQAVAVRESPFAPAAAEAVLRQVALQVDEAAGRDDRLVSNMVFIIFGRIRRNRQLGLPVGAAQVAGDVILERLAIDRLTSTRALMTDAHHRRRLDAVFEGRAIWWTAFTELYKIAPSGAPGTRRARAGAWEHFAVRRTPVSDMVTQAGQNAGAPAAAGELSRLARRLGKWLMPRPHLH